MAAPLGGEDAKALYLPVLVLFQQNVPTRWVIAVSLGNISTKQLQHYSCDKPYDQITLLTRLICFICARHVILDSPNRCVRHF